MLHLGTQVACIFFCLFLHQVLDQYFGYSGEIIGIPPVNDCLQETYEILTKYECMHIHHNAWTILTFGIDIDRGASEILERSADFSGLVDDLLPADSYSYDSPDWMPSWLNDVLPWVLGHNASLNVVA